MYIWYQRCLYKMIPFYRLLLLPLLFFSVTVVCAQNPELVKFGDLTFNSEFEKKVFADIQNSQTDYLHLFLGISPNTNNELAERIKQKIQIDSERISQKKFNQLKDDKKVSRIYELVNKEILNRYKEETLFPDIFSSGNFNCLTASAYYGFLFTKLGISFEFRESANHVHPVAFPLTMQIKVETTDPVYGFQYFDTKLKVQFVNYLLTTKIISKEEATNSSVDSIFNKYYFPESSIGMKELAGLQYLNDAFYNYGRDNFKYAFNQIQKAYYLYPSQRVSTVMLFLLSRCIAETKYEVPEDAAYLAYAARYVGKELELEVFLNEFNNLTNNVLVERSQIALYDRIFTFLSENIDEGSVRNALIAEYYKNKGRVLISTFRVKEALANFEKALSLEPENLEIQTLTVSSLAYSFSSASSQEVVNSIEEFERRFPLMQKNETFISLQMLGYLQYSEEKFDFEKPLEGEVLLKKFENLYKMHKGISINYEKVGDAYSAAAVYYFKRSDKKTAREYLNRGLEISPENYQPMYRLRAL